MLSFAGAFLLFFGAARGAQDDDAIYQSLVNRVKGGDFTVDFRALRLACIKSRACQPRGTMAVLIAMNAAHEQGDVAAETRWAELLVEHGFVNGEAHATLAALYAKANEPVKAKFHLDVTAALLRSILSSGDGKTKETAFAVIADREEYAALTAIGLPYTGGSVSPFRFQEGGHHFNKWEIPDASTGETRTVFFNEDACSLEKSFATRLPSH